MSKNIQFKKMEKIWLNFPCSGGLNSSMKREKGSSPRLSHVYRSFNFLDTFSQLSIPGYLPPHSFYDTADRTKSVDIEILTYLL